MFSPTAADVWKCLPDGGLEVVEVIPEAVPSPGDQGIPPSQGDDRSPVNSIRPGKLNGLATLAVANIGFSSSSGSKKVFPSSQQYEIEVTDEQGGYGMNLVLSKIGSQQKTTAAANGVEKFNDSNSLPISSMLGTSSGPRRPRDRSIRPV